VGRKGEGSVYQHKRKGLWVAALTVNGERISTYHRTEEAGPLTFDAPARPVEPAPIRPGRIPPARRRVDRHDGMEGSVSEQELTLAEAAEVAAQLGRPVKPVTLRMWCITGHMRCRLVGRGRHALYLVTCADLEKALAEAPRPGGYRPRRVTEGEP
jgi:hypothetical protein